MPLSLRSKLQRAPNIQALTVPRTVIHYRVAATLPNAAGANLPDNKPRKRFNYKPNASKGFEGSSRGTFPKVPLE